MLPQPYYGPKISRFSFFFFEIMAELYIGSLPPTHEGRDPPPQRRFPHPPTTSNKCDINDMLIMSGSCNRTFQTLIAIRNAHYNKKMCSL